MRKRFGIFTIRWLLNSLGLWVAVRLFGTGSTSDQVTAGIVGFLFAGLVFSFVNSLLKPIVTILSLPAILLSLGLFVLVVNGLMVYVTIKLSPGISMTFLNSILTGMLLSLVNYIVSAALDIRSREVQEG